METENTPNEDGWTRLRSALEDNQFKWRTVSGLARDSGLPVADVLSLLQEHREEIVKSAIPSEKGEALYTTRKHYKVRTSFLGAVKQSLTGRVE